MTFEQFLNHPTLQAVGHALLQFIWQGALLAAVLLASNLVTRRSDPRLRYALACLVMISMPAVFGATIFRALPSSSYRPVHSNLPKTARPARVSVSGATLIEEFRRAPRHETRVFGWAAALWLAGVLALCLYTAGGWMRVRMLRRCATFMPDMHAKLAALGKRLGVTRPIRLYLSVAVDVPAVVGYLRPYILLPISAITGLDESQLAAILAHELAHVRRHDYLVNMIQSAVETVLFFHPAVWWISHRIREERELCCDDLAVGVCGDRVVYARALAQLEELRGTIPEGALAASGGNLLARIRRLLGQPPVSRLTVPAGAGIAALLVLGATLGIGALQILVTTAAQAQPAAPRPAFEVVSIKPTPKDAPVDFYGCKGGPGSSDPGHIICSHWSPTESLAVAYGVVPSLIWSPKLNGDAPEYEIVAKVPVGSTKADVGPMWRSFLEDRFKVKVRRETREMPVYELVLNKGGFKGKEWVDRKPGDPADVPNELGTANRDSDGFPIIPAGETMGLFTGGKAYLAAPAGTIKDLARMIEGRLSRGSGERRPLLDATGLTGKYDIKLTWSPGADNPQPGKEAPEGQSMLEALETQLGLKIRQGKANVEMLVVEHIEKEPTNN